jgi:hypothetical protein
LLAMRREKAEGQAGSEANDRTRSKCREYLQHPELVARIFSREDREFICLTRSPRLLRIYKEERRNVALHWVQRTSRDIRGIMWTHRLISRQSHNLDVATETKLLFQYLELRVICALLVFLIRISGPHTLHDLASYAVELYQRIGRALPDTAAANRVVSPESRSTL